MVGMGGAMGPVWWEGRPVVGTETSTCCRSRNPCHLVKKGMGMVMA